MKQKKIKNRKLIEYDINRVRLNIDLFIEEYNTKKIKMITNG